MTSCPVCGKQVDPLRAPAVGVRDGKVVSYCSKDCAALAESGPTKLIPTKVMRLPSGAENPFTASGVVKPVVAAPDSGPVIEIIREPSAPVVVAEAKPRRKRADSSSVQIADTGRLDDYVTSDEPRGRGVLIAIALLVTLGAGGAAAYYLYFAKKTAPVVAPLRDAAVVVAPPIDAAPAITREVAVARAEDALRTQLKSDSPRVQRVAASALSRTGDAASIEVLAAALVKETGDLAKVDLAYALARAGDKRGFDALMAASGSGKREAKHEAGRRFALLGDKRAIAVLESSLLYPQFKLGVAEQLAYLAEPRALKILDEVRADPKALADEKARAAIALGYAGRADIAPALHELLADDRNNAFAAPALAALHDEAARPVLVKQLTIPSLRVEAARGLRRLAPDADVAPLLPLLLDALASNKDTEQVQIAEALLLLAGPAAWSERE